MKLMKNKIKPATYVFIDATNIIYGANKAGFKVDFKKLMVYLNERYNSLKVFYYAGVDSTNQKQLAFYKKLESFGYILRLVPVKTYKDGKKKADVDSRMTFEIMLHLNHYSQAILMTGDGDFFWVFEYLIKNKIITKLFANSSSTAKELKQLFKNNFTDIRLLKHLIERQKNEADAFVESASRDYDKSIAKVRKFVKRAKLLQKIALINERKIK